ncbi:immunoglobulin kappa light chain-like [Garra rufa]|uniref:immunoglobulin kappa light chain-like n=1 Tax=Garra rufa TaxID=137080 RepID=UPI003CCE7D94
MFLYIYIILLLVMPAAVLGVSVDQGPKVLVKAKGKTVYLPCKATGLGSSDYIHWYQIKDGEAPSRLLYISEAGSFTRDTNNPQANDFTVDRTKLYDLKLSNIQESHAAVYFCAYWDTSGSHMGNWIKRFGSGTRLIVTESGKDKAIAPKLSGYLPKENPDKHGKQTMLCQASGMFPDLVRFAWKKKDAGTWKDVSEGEVVEQRNESPVSVTSMLILDKDKAKNDNYQCNVFHEGGADKPQSLEMKKGDSKEQTKESKDDDQNPTCPPSTGDPIKKEMSGDSEQISSMPLLVYAYGAMLMKNGLFFFVVSIFLIKRRAGKKDESS